MLIVQPHQQKSLFTNINASEQLCINSCFVLKTRIFLSSGSKSLNFHVCLVLKESKYMILLVNMELVYGTFTTLYSRELSVQPMKTRWHGAL